MLRGDSTLRAHLWEEYDALRAVVAPGRADVPLLLVPALPAAGRVTVDGVHLLERDGERVPLDRTEYARDGALAYSDAELGRWADERSGGRLAAADAVDVPLERLRRRPARARSRRRSPPRASARAAGRRRSPTPRPTTTCATIAARPGEAEDGGHRR